MWRLPYSLLMRAALPLILARLWWRGRREPLYRRRIGERLGYYRDRPAAQPLIWLHAVSVGEARASAGLVRSLKSTHPGHEMLLTCMTAAGREALRELHGESVRIAWLPYDYPAAARRFVEHFRPRLAVLMETEIWPNLIAACGEHGIPVMLANARMSEKSARSYRRWRGLTQPAIASLAAICAQSKDDAARLRALGARSIAIAGNMKFDIAPDEAKGAAGRAWRSLLGRPVLLLASTREGDETSLLASLPAWDGNLLALVVPRHPRRFDEVSLLSQSRRSRKPMPAATDRIHLGDTMGEMDFYYAAADLAVIGGSFAPHGGQNLIEACAAGVPVVFGPSMFNFSEAARLALETGAAVQSEDAAGAIREAVRLLADPELMKKMGAAGRALCDAHRGATLRHLELCRELLGNTRAPGPG